MQQSKLIYDFFKQTFESPAVESDFWHFVHETPLYHTLQNDTDRPSKAFDNGYELACDAQNGGNLPIYYHEENSYTLYFLGSEETIVAYLNSKYNEWKDSLPEPPTEQELLQDKIQKAELEAKKAKQKLKRLQKRIKSNKIED